MRTDVTWSGPRRRAGGARLHSLITEYVGDKWDRQEMETPVAYSHFLVYRDLGPTRTITAAAQVVGRGRAHFPELSVAFNWRDRAAAWDDYLATVAQQEAVAARREMARRHLDIGMRMQRKALKAIRSLSDTDLAELAVKKPEAVVRMLEGGVKIEREARDVEQTDGSEGEGAAIAATRLARAMLLNPDAQEHAFKAFDMLAEQGDREVVLDATTGDPLELPGGPL